MKYICVVILIVFLGISSICGFMVSILLFEMSAYSDAIFVFLVMLGTGGFSSLLLDKILNQSWIYWTLLFSGNGMLIGFVWWAIPTPHDGLKILSITIIYGVSAFLLVKHRKMFIKNRNAGC